MTLWERGSHVSQRGSHVSESVCCIIVVSKDVECLIGFRHEKLGFVKQVATINCSRGLSMDQFGDDMFGVSEYQNLPDFFSV